VNDPLDHIIFFRDLPPERQSDQRARLLSDSDTATVFEAWERLREEVRRNLVEAFPDPDLFVLHVLVELGHEQVLREEERARVRETLPALRHALDQHPGLAAVVDEIRSAAESFDRIWDEQMSPATSSGRTPGSTRSAPSMRHERPPQPSRHTVRSPRGEPGRTRPRGRWGVRAAAAVSFCVFLALLVFVLQREHGMTTVATAGEARIVDLGDGSNARLLPHSRLSFTSPDDAAPLGRQAVLEGNAYFEIAPAHGGFVVKTGTAQMTVLGTSFGVRASEDETEVVLADGRLSVSARHDPAATVVLRAGQVSRVAAGSPPSTPEDVAVHEQLSWTGLFVFASTTFSEIAEALQDHYGVDVEVTADIRGERLTGQFEQRQPLAEILHTLAAAAGANIHPTPDGGYRIARD